MNHASRRRRKPLLSRLTVQFFEPLERRVFLCATAAELIAKGVPARFVGDDGHISRSNFATLSPRLQAHIDPHWIEEDVRPGGVDWDKELGIPLHPEGPPTGAGITGGPDADALPDFFPQILSGNLDQTTQPGRNLLRFGTQVNNQGAGPAVLISGNAGDAIPTGAPITSWINPDGSQNVLQAVYSYNGSSFALSYYRAGGRFTYHPGHNHWHFDGYAHYKLRHNNGGVPGAYVTRGDGTEVVGAKTGFCLLTFSGTFTTEGGQNSSTLPGFNQDTAIVSGCDLKQGIRVGRYDQYSSGLEGQWLDVTGVPNGNYFVEIKMDGEDAILESNEANNAKSFPVTLSANPPVGGITPDQFDTGGNNDSFATATDRGDLGVQTQTGLNIHWGQDEDYFRFVATSSGLGSVSATAANGNIELYLYDSNQVQIGQSTNPSGTETINYNFVKGQTYFAEATCYNSTTSSNYQIAWNIKPEVTNSVGTPLGRELGAVPASFLIARNGPTTGPLNVPFTLGGTAVNGVDYQLVNTTAAFGDLQSVREIQIIPISDGLIEGTETVTLTINSNTAYVIGAPAAQQVTINDTPPQVSQTVQTWQTSPHKLAFTFTLDVSASFADGDVVIMNTDTNAPVTPASIVYGAGNVATVTFAGVLPDGHYQATLSGSGITHAMGTPMDSDYVYNFFVMTADANHDAKVNVNDFTILAANFNQSPRDASQGDFNYDGIVNVDDFTILASRFGTALTPLSTPTSTGARGRTGGATGPSALRSLFADGKGIDETQQRLIDLLA